MWLMMLWRTHQYYFMIDLVLGLLRSTSTLIHVITPWGSHSPLSSGVSSSEPLCSCGGVFIAHSYPASSSQTHPRVWFWRFSAPAWLALGLYVPSSCLASCHRVIQDGGCRAEVTGRRWKMLFSSFSSRETSRSGH